MKSDEPAGVFPERRLTDAKAVDAVPDARVSGPIRRQSGESDSRSNPLQGKDDTRVFLHQLSQTLTSLRGTLELALLVDSDEQEYRRVIEQALVQAEVLFQLFRSYRALTEGETSNLMNDDVRVGELVRVALEQLRPLSDSRRLAVHVEYGDKCLVQTDPARLLVALRRGLRRAIQQSPTGGKLQVRLATKMSSACLAISATTPGADAHSEPGFDEIPDLEFGKRLTSGSVEGHWTPVRRAVEALGGSLLTLTTANSPLICEICLPLSSHEGP
jgi:K+-sensing histidine kinase KdpD